MVEGEPGAASSIVVGYEESSGDVVSCLISVFVDLRFLGAGRRGVDNCRLEE